MKKNLRHLLLIGVLFIIIGSILYFEGGRKKLPPPSENTATHLGAPEISTPDGFINTEKISVGELIGKKIILVDFWTYSCINCQRTTPYLNAWYEAYAEKGLEILAIHTPEFEFEEKYDNVKRAVEKFNIKYPVILDNDYSTWRDYKNRYWPHKYLIDINGQIVYDHIGEGGYEETEQEIQKALRGRAQALKISDEAMPTVLVTNGVKVSKTPSIRQSPEIYFGADRNEYLGNGTPGRTGVQKFSLTDTQASRSNTLYLGGEWELTDQYAKSTAGEARIVFRYTAGQVYFVASAEKPVQIQVYRDGQPVGPHAGADVDGTRSLLTIQEDRLYHLIDEKEAPGEHLLELVVEKPGLKAFTFTFGS